MGRSSLVRRALLTAMIVPMLAGCHSWRPTTAPPRDVIELEAPRTVRITREDGSVTTVLGPRLVADSIIGTTASGTTRIATADVWTLEVERSSPVRTTALVVGHVSAVVSLIALIIAFQPHYSGF
jgi:hypothetical protein